MQQEAIFRLLGYHFSKVSLDLTDIPSNASFEISFNPKGIFMPIKSKYQLIFDFNAHLKGENNNTENIAVTCEASFEFDSIHNVNEIPDFFYPNSIAIVFPYIRAFIGSMTLLANVKPILLPTFNLTSLKDALKSNTLVMEQA